MTAEIPNNPESQAEEQAQRPLTPLDIIRGTIKDKLKFDALDASPRVMPTALTSVEIRQYRIEDPEWQRHFRNGLFVEKSIALNHGQRRDYNAGDFIPVWNEKWVPDPCTVRLVTDLREQGWNLVQVGSAHEWDMQPEKMRLLEQAFGKDNVRMHMYGATTLRGDEPVPFVLFFVKKNIAH
jgi:hypothetical protein